MLKSSPNPVRAEEMQQVTVQIAPKSMRRLEA